MTVDLLGLDGLSNKEFGNIDCPVYPFSCVDVDTLWHKTSERVPICIAIQVDEYASDSFDSPELCFCQLSRTYWGYYRGHSVSEASARI